MKVYVLRHGESEYNKRHIVQGNRDIPLSKEGLAQARAVRRRVLLDGTAPFDRVYSSPLQRAYATGEIVSGMDRSAFILDPRLREIEVGGLEGMSTRDPCEAMVNFTSRPALYVPLPGGETFQELAGRAENFLTWLRGQDLPEKTLVCTHNGWMHAMLMVLEGMPVEDFRRFRIPNCTMYVLEPEEADGWKVTDILPGPEDAGGEW